MESINWRRGFFRIWIVLVLIYVYMLWLGGFFAGALSSPSKDDLLKAFDTVETIKLLEYSQKGDVTGIGPIDDLLEQTGLSPSMSPQAALKALEAKGINPDAITDETMKDYTSQLKAFEQKSRVSIKAKNQKAKQCAQDYIIELSYLGNTVKTCPTEGDVQGVYETWKSQVQSNQVNVIKVVVLPPLFVLFLVLILPWIFSGFASSANSSSSKKK